MEYIWAIKKWNNAICSNIDEPWRLSYWTEGSESDREKHIRDVIIYNLILKKWTYVQNRNDLGAVENKLMIT